MGKGISNPALDALSGKQRAFVLGYLHNGFNATQAGLAAGYSKANARAQASRLLTKANIRAAISEQLDRQGITPEKIKVALAEIAFGADLADFGGFLAGDKLKDLRNDGLNTKLVKAVAVSQTQYGENRRIELHDRLGALKELGRVLGIVTEGHRIEGAMELGVPGVAPEDLAAFYRWKAEQNGGPKDV